MLDRHGQSALFESLQCRYRELFSQPIYASLLEPKCFQFKNFHTSLGAQHTDDFASHCSHHCGQHGMASRISLKSIFILGFHFQTFFLSLTLRLTLLKLYEPSTCSNFFLFYFFVVFVVVRTLKGEKKIRCWCFAPVLLDSCCVMKG